jgi:geranylgeranyl diphosphate synthase, type I
MEEIIKQIKSEILDHIDRSFDLHRKGIKNLDRWGKDSFLRISEFVSRGKLIRGVLSVAIYRALGGKEKESILSVASSIEMLHAGFLMHDDVMDGDRVRRGKPAIHAAYEKTFEKESLTNPVKNGESFAICLGNISYFLAFDFIAGSGFRADISNRLNRILNREAVITGFGQMNDIFTASSELFPEREVILETYRMKTARYTFSLPLIIGAVCAEASQEIIERFSEIGENIGTIFQLRDDELNIFGEVEGTGKSVGSDISEGKKTLLISMLLSNITGNTKNIVNNIFSKENITEQELTEIRNIMTESGTKQEHTDFINELSETTSRKISELKIPEECRNILEHILRLSFERKY